MNNAEIIAQWIHYVLQHILWVLNAGLFLHTKPEISWEQLELPVIIVMNASSKTQVILLVSLK
jgi:hypothetical protein